MEGGKKGDKSTHPCDHGTSLHNAAKNSDGSINNIISPNHQSIALQNPGRLALAITCIKHRTKHAKIAPVKAN